MYFERGQEAVCFAMSLQALDSGEKGHKVTVAKIPDNKLCNRFGNIAVCESTSSLGIVMILD